MTDASPVVAPSSVETATETTTSYVAPFVYRARDERLVVARAPPITTDVPDDGALGYELANIRGILADLLTHLVGQPDHAEAVAPLIDRLNPENRDVLTTTTTTANAAGEVDPTQTVETATATRPTGL